MTEVVQHLAVVWESQAEQPPFGQLMRLAAALQKQCARDLRPIWEINATVDAFERLEDVPLDYWPMIISDQVPAGAGGIHQDDRGQPFALIRPYQDADQLSLTVSHEALEMLVDPFGRYLIAGDSIMNGQGRVEYLVEVCDPSEHAQFGYSINGVLVSDFYTPHYFDPMRAAGVRYSFSGEIAQPRQVLVGGYLSWHDPQSDDWWQQTWFGGSAPEFRNLGRLGNGSNFRSLIDRQIASETSAAIAAGRGASLFASAVGSGVPASEGRAEALRSCIGRIIEERTQASAEAADGA